MNRTTSPDVATYAAAVRQALSDLDPATAEGLLDGLDEHLAEVAAGDPDVALVEVIGPAGVYATELRQSAGAPPARIDSPRAIGEGRALPPPPPPSPSAPEPAAANGSADSPARRARDGDSLPISASMVARCALIVGVIVFIVAIVGSSDRVAPRKILFAVALVGAGWLAALFARERSSFGSRTNRRVGVGLGALAVLGGVVVGAHMANGQNQFDTFSPTPTTFCCAPVMTIPVIGDGGVQRVFLEDVVGLPVEQASIILSASGLPWTVIYEETPGIADGTVIRQSPAGGSVVVPDVTVTLVVAGFAETPMTTMTTFPSPASVVTASTQS